MVIDAASTVGDTDSCAVRFSRREIQVYTGGIHARDRFRSLVDANGPFVSIYFDDSHDTQDAAAQLDARLRDVRKHLEEQSVDVDA